MLHRTYSDPTGMLNTALMLGDLTGLLRSIAVADDESASWDVWLAKVWDKDFLEFVSDVKAAKGKAAKHSDAPLTEEYQAKIINESLAIAGISFFGGGE